EERARWCLQSALFSDWSTTLLGRRRNPAKIGIHGSPPGCSLWCPSFAQLGSSLLFAQPVPVRLLQPPKPVLTLVRICILATSASRVDVRQRQSDGISHLARLLYCLPGFSTTNLRHLFGYDTRVPWPQCGRQGIARPPTAAFARDY